MLDYSPTFEGNLPSSSHSILCALSQHAHMHIITWKCTIADYHTKNCHVSHIPKRCMISYQELSCLVHTPTMHDISYQEMSWSVDVHMIPVSTCYVLTSSICNCKMHNSWKMAKVGNVRYMYFSKCTN